MTGLEVWTDALSAKLTAHIQSRFPGITDGQRAKLDAAYRANPSGWAMVHLAGFESTIDFILDKITATDARLTSRAPLDRELVAIAEAKHASQFGVGFDAQQKIAAQRRLAGLSVDERIGLLPSDKALPPIVEKAAPAASTATKYSQMSPEELDAIVLDRFGKTKHALSTLERQRLHNAIKRTDAVISTPLVDQVAGGAKDESNLGPTDRIKLFREREKLARAEKEST